MEKTLWTDDLKKEFIDQMIMIMKDDIPIDTPRFLSVLSCISSVVFAKFTPVDLNNPKNSKDIKFIIQKCINDVDNENPDNHTNTDHTNTDHKNPDNHTNHKNPDNHTNPTNPDNHTNPTNPTNPTNTDHTNTDHTNTVKPNKKSNFLMVCLISIGVICILVYAYKKLSKKTRNDRIRK
jgi:hypothetical protein